MDADRLLTILLAVIPAFITLGISYNKLTSANEKISDLEKKLDKHSESNGTRLETINKSITKLESWREMERERRITRNFEPSVDNENDNKHHR